MLDQETKRRINSARDILVGKIPDPKSQIEQITTALIYKFMDDMDRESEEIDRKAAFLVGDLSEFAWGKLMSKRLSGNDRWDLYSRALESFTKSKQIPELFRTIFKSAYLPFRDPQTLNLFLKEINCFQYDHSERLGDAFEYLLSVLGSQGDAGQFRTPRHIIDFIVEVVAPQKSEKVLDPACGTAGFLISSYKYIKKYNSSNFDPQKDSLPFEHNESADINSLSIQSNGRYKGDKFTLDDRKKLSENISGCDIAPEMVRLALVNLYLHGFKSSKISEYDTLTYEDKWDENFDVILANPPFMTPKGGIKPHKRFSVHAKRAEVLFVDYIAEHLSIRGRAGVIVPEGIIFQAAKAYKNLRKNLIENWGLYAVASLPRGVFRPYGGVKTSILLLDKELAKKTDEILFVKVENDGFDLGAQRRKINKNDLPQAFEILKEWQTSQKIAAKNEKLAHSAAKEKIAANGEYNLTSNRYRETVDYTNAKWPMVALGEVFRIESGGTPSSKNLAYWDGSIKWATLTDIPESVRFISKTKKTITEEGLKNSSAKLLPKGTILISSRATIGRIAVINCEMATNQGFKNIIVNNKHNSLFVSYILSNQVEKMNLLASGGTFKEISKSAISTIQIPLPPLEVQEQIVAEIEQYQKIIDGAKQVVEHWKPSFRIDPDWPMVALGKVCEYEQPTNYLVKSTNYKHEYKIPVLTAGKSFLLGYTNEETNISQKKTCL